MKASRLLPAIILASTAVASALTTDQTLTGGLTDSEIIVNVPNGSGISGPVTAGETHTYTATDGDIRITSVSPAVYINKTNTTIEFNAPNGRIILVDTGGNPAVAISGVNNKLFFNDFTEITSRYPESVPGFSSSIVYIGGSSRVDFHAGGRINCNGSFDTAFRVEGRSSDSRAWAGLHKGEYHIKGGVSLTNADMLMHLTGNSIFDGWVAANAEGPNKGALIALEGNSIWNVVRDSTLMSLSANSGAINFGLTDNGSLSTIATTSGAVIQSGAILAIDVDGSAVNRGDSYRLFTGDIHLCEGLLQSADGQWLFDYTRGSGDEQGLFTITGKQYIGAIPEPSTAVLSLLALASLAGRRRRAS